jgi:kinesin family protein 11
MENNVQVAVRCRPVNDREKAANRGPVVQCKQATNEITVIKRKTYSFDKVYGQYSEQKDLFKNTVKPVVDESLAGYNCTIFAYGQTGTGKTYTMLGNLAPEHKNAGIIPRAVQYIFETLQSTQQEYSVKVSFLQLYNEV